VTDSPLSQALNSLTLADVWELAPDNSETPRRDGLRTSPFREDRKPSFSIYGGLNRYKDQATDEPAGGVWTFVAACRPEWSKRDIAQYLIERAGLQWDERAPKSKSLTELRKERQEQARLKREKLLRDAKKGLDPGRVQLPKHPWPEFVAERYREGLTDPGHRIDRLAQKRQWPVEWVDVLCDMGLISFPALPWSERRFPAFPVTDATHQHVGYHQRIWSQDDGPAWLYVPYHPRQGNNRFTSQLQEYAHDKDGPFVPPLPYVLGDPASATLWILTEGQWDAITIFGLMGGLDDVFDLPVAVFGLRGAEAGPVTFLAAYGPMLRRHKPHIWMIPDNDKAGAWDGRGKDQGFAAPRPWSFASKLLDYVGRNRRIPVSRIPARFGKDFNDYYRTAALSRHTFLGNLERLFPAWLNLQT